MCKSQRISTIKRQGFGLIELLFVMGILTFVLAGSLGILGQAQSSFFTTDANIDLRNSLRNSAERIALELRNTGYQTGVAQFTISDNTGTGGSDIIRFSVPILCSTVAPNNTLLDANGNPANWGAPLTFGCNSSSCMDANNSCTILEYKHVQYLINASNQLERKVLSTALAVVNGSTTTVGRDIINFQVTLSADTRVLTFVLTGQKKTPTGRTITASYSEDVLLNNLGG